jgi:DNA-binding NarL/FixJ family response regulator
MHARPLMTAGLAAALHDREWSVTTLDIEPGAAAGADLVIADYDTGLAIARGRHVLIVTQRAREADVLRACAAAVAGYLLEDVDAADLRHAVRRILTGDRHYSQGVTKHLEAGTCREHLTNRETDVLRLLAGGRCDKQIARDLGIGVGTVRWHLRNLMGKLGVSARLQAVVVAAQRGIVGIDGVVPG